MSPQETNLPRPNVYNLHPTVISHNIKTQSDWGIWGIWRARQHLELTVMFLKPFLKIFCSVAGTLSCWKRPIFLLQIRTAKKWTNRYFVFFNFFFFSSVRTVHADSATGIAPEKASHWYWQERLPSATNCFCLFLYITKVTARVGSITFQYLQL